MTSLLVSIVCGILAGFVGIVATVLIRRRLGLIHGAAVGALILIVLTPLCSAAVQAASQYWKWRQDDQRIQELLDSSVIISQTTIDEPERVTIYTLDDEPHEVSRVHFDLRLRKKLTVVYSVLVFVTGAVFLGIAVGMMASRRT